MGFEIYTGGEILFWPREFAIQTFAAFAARATRLALLFVTCEFYFSKGKKQNGRFFLPFSLIPPAHVRECVNPVQNYAPYDYSYVSRQTSRLYDITASSGTLKLVSSFIARNFLGPRRLRESEVGSLICPVVSHSRRNDGICGTTRPDKTTNRACCAAHSFRQRSVPLPVLVPTDIVFNETTFSKATALTIRGWPRWVQSV